MKFAIFRMPKAGREKNLAAFIMTRWLRLRHLTINEGKGAVGASMRPIHPGEILREGLAELELSANALADALGVPASRITAILKEKRTVTADTALRLARYFGTTPEFWMNLQIAYEIRKSEAKSGEQIERTVQPRAT